MNGIDAVVIATGNDFKTVKQVHMHMHQEKGTYQSLSNAYIKNKYFYFELTLPMAIGTVGGVTIYILLLNWH